MDFILLKGDFGFFATALGSWVSRFMIAYLTDLAIPSLVQIQDQQARRPRCGWRVVS